MSAKVEQSRLRQFSLAVAAAIIGVIAQLPTQAQDADSERLDPEAIKALRQLSTLNGTVNTEAARHRMQILIRKAQEYSPSLHEARFNVYAADQDILAAKGNRQPQVTATGNSQLSRSDLSTASRSDGKPYLTLSATLPIYDWGRIDALVSGREAARTAAEARYRQQANQVASEVVNTCLEYTKQRALIAAADDYYETVRRLVEMLTRITEADTGRVGELVQARSRQLQAQQARENARSRVREQRVRLDRLIGKEQTAACDGVGSNLLQRPELDEVIARIRHTPQIQAFESDYASQIRAMEQISATRKPQVQVAAVHAPIAAGITDQYYQALTLSVSVPIYDGKILQSNERAALERANAASARVDQTARQLDAEYRERYEEANANLRRADEYVSLLEINDRVRKDFFTQWAALGRRSLFELLAIEQEQFTLQNGYFTSLFDSMIGYATVLGSADLLVRE